MLPEQERRKALKCLTDKEATGLLYDWEYRARPNQLPPPGDWLVWLIMAGRGMGKTRAGAEFILREIKAGRTRHIALVAKTPADARDVMIEGDSGLLSISPPWDRPLYEPSKRRLTWNNGVIALVFSSKEPDQLRGPQYDLCFIAGTMIATSEGERPIETIRTGNYVLTRKGNRRVIATSNRLFGVGKVKFSNGAELVVTPQHPVLQLNGWTRIQELEKGAIVCAGMKTLMATSSPIKLGQGLPSEARGISVASVVSTWEDVGQAIVYNLTVEDQHEYMANGIIVHNCWGDEIRTWYYPQETWDNLLFGLRLGEHPRVVVTTTPLPLEVIKKIMKAPDTVITTGTTYENRANLAPSFFKQIISKYEGTRLGRQEINAELLEDVPGALWNRNLIKYQDAPELQRVVVAIDPAVTSIEGSNETGIIIAGKGIDGFGYILADRSARVSPDSWARRAIQAYDDFKADRIIGEVNNGGEMVGLTIKTVRVVPYKAVHASRGKQVRAEPVAALYEQGKIFHVKPFPELEDQLATWTPESGESPDRLDALVWAITELMLQTSEWRRL